MFGFRKKTADHDTQIPYQVYQTVQEPVTRRKRWIVRLVAVLVVVTLAVFGGLAIDKHLTHKKSSSGGASSQQADQVQQPPQKNIKVHNLPGQPAKTPLTGTTSTSKVDQPQ